MDVQTASLMHLPRLEYRSSMVSVLSATFCAPWASAHIETVQRLSVLVHDFGAGSLPVFGHPKYPNCEKTACF